MCRYFRQVCTQLKFISRIPISSINGWPCLVIVGLWSMAINEGCKFRDQGSIPSVCQITDAKVGQIG